MADVITRFKLETTQYDSKLRDASKGLAEYTRQATMAGREFGKFTQSNVEAARALGNITPSATNAKDKVKELVGAFNDAAKAYNALTKEQQQSDFGKAMAESLGQLSQQLKEAKKELYDMGDAVKNAGGDGLFSGLGDKMSGAMQVFAGNMMTKAVGAVANLGSELMETAKQSVELAQKGEGVRIAFERLNNPGLLANLKEATHGTVSELELMKAAVKFDDFKLPVEQLGTMLAFAQKKASDTGQSVDYMVDSIVTGLGRKSLPILDNLGISASQVKERMGETGDMTKAVADIIREEMEKSGGYVETAADRAARATAQAQDKMMELGRAAIPVAEAYNEAWGEIRLGAMELMTTVLVPIANFLKQLRGESSMTAEDAMTRGMTDVTDTVDDNGRLIRKDAISNIPEITVSGTAPKKRSGGGSRSVGSRKAFDVSSIAFDANKAMLSAVKGTDEGPSEVWKAITEGAKESTSSVEDLTAAFEKLNKVQGVTANDADKDSGNLADNWRNAGTAIGAVGAAMSQIEDPAAKVMGTIAQAIATIALTYASSLKGTFTPWDWIAGAASGLATMISVISAIHSATGYAEGGMIKGNSYSGDSIGGLVDGSQLVGLNAGEVVLNAAQQNTLAQSLQGNGGTVNVVGRVVGEDIFLSADRYARRSGRGSILTGKNL